MTLYELQTRNEQLLSQAKDLLQQASVYSGASGLFEGWKRVEFDRLMNERARLLNEYNKNSVLIEQMTGSNGLLFSGQSINRWTQAADTGAAWQTALTDTGKDVAFWKNPLFLAGAGAVLTIVIWRNLK